MRYYHAEHQAAYQRLVQQGLTQWSDLFGETDEYDVFPNRPFLEHALTQLDLPPEPDVLEYGCGTGPAACFLAARGFRVDAIDLIPEAITLARGFARQRGVDVDFSVQDVCAMGAGSKQYDVVLDSYCLQSIVTDTDRANLLGAVRDRLKTTGYYVLSTAMYDPDRVYEGNFRYDASSGICYEAAAPAADAIQLDGTWYLPHRRHLRPAALRAELETAGLSVLSQAGGDVICVRYHET
ncbi:methyltransferase family protein [Kribbella rubisoli]|uniref:Methyltransferase family protein n=1 Tax=Kribbella rubisoli TaxID=3075929 RepID=A0A4Q7VYC7_9ACTN|nr:class I SAM-dependent methyltransferase [Kribbella rubisoli]RZU01693.1 methyltransferase family protein [Kribbella rubisoli]